MPYRTQVSTRCYLSKHKKNLFNSVDIHVVHKSMHYRWGHDAVAYPKHIPL